MAKSIDGVPRSFCAKGTKKYFEKRCGPLSNFAEENRPVTMESTGVDVNTVYENTTLDASEFFSKQAFNQIKSTAPKSKTNEVNELYDLKGLKVDPEKNTALTKFPIAIIHTEVKSFLGLCSYYRRYVENFAQIASPLHKITDFNPSFNWRLEVQTPFKTLQSRLLTIPFLGFPSMQEPLS